jgi:outer membrane protein assembly factor BamB
MASYRTPNPSIPSWIRPTACAEVTWERAIPRSRSGFLTVPHIDGVFVHHKDVLDAATGTTLWTLPWHPDENKWTAVAGCANHGVFGEDLVVFTPAPGHGSSVAGCDPRTGAVRWRTERSSIRLSIWTDHGLRPRYMTSGLDGPGESDWAKIEAHADRVEWHTLDSTPRVGAASTPPPTQVLLGMAEDDYIPHKIVGLDARDGRILWRLGDPGWRLVGASTDRIAMMRLWRNLDPAPTLCVSHSLKMDEDGGPLAGPGGLVCAACSADVAVRVLDRATAKEVWTYSWRSAGAFSDWSVALPFLNGQHQGTGAVCGDTLITGEGDELCGRSMRDGSVLWTSSVPLGPFDDDARFDLSTPALQDHDEWLPIHIEDGRHALAVHVATGATAYVPGRVECIIGDTAITCYGPQVQGWRLFP